MLSPVFVAYHLKFSDKSTEPTLIPTGIAPLRHPELHPGNVPAESLPGLFPPGEARDSDPGRTGVDCNFLALHVRKRFGNSFVLATNCRYVIWTLVTLTLVLYSRPVMAQQWADDMFTTREHSFGMVAKNADAVYEFKFNNPYKEDVVISGVRTSCTCTTPSLSTKSLSSHQEGAVIAKFNTDRFSGQRSATITVSIEKPYRAEVQLKVSGFIRSDVIIEPGKINFGTIPASQEPVKTIQIDYRGGNRNWEIKDVLSAYSHIRVSKKEITRRPGLVSYQLSARLLPDVDVGMNQAELILVTNDPSQSKIPLAMTANVLAPFEVLPSELELGTLTPGQTVVKHVLIRATEACEIESVQCNDPSVSVTKPDGEKKLHRIPVRFTAGESGVVNATVSLKSKSGAQAQIPIHATIAAN